MLRSYLATVESVNSKQWVSATAMCRRTLEGVTKSLLPDEKRKHTLAQQLKEVPSHKDFADPILVLADAIREGGNLGAHFDLEREPDEQVATLMLELLEDLIEYVFVLPKRIDELREKIDTLGADAANAET